MKKLKNLGKALTKAEQKTISGGKYNAPECDANEDCGSNVNYTDPVTGAQTCYNVYCDINHQCQMAICN